jgi:hypothetical protein
VQCALERGSGGRAYFIKEHETTTFRDFVAMLADLQGLSVSGLKSVSIGFAFTIGWLMEVGATIRFSKTIRPRHAQWCGGLGGNLLLAMRLRAVNWGISPG